MVIASILLLFLVLLLPPAIVAVRSTGWNHPDQLLLLRLMTLLLRLERQRGEGRRLLLRLLSCYHLISG